MRVARIFVLALACACALAGAHSAFAAGPIVVPRPTNGGEFAYTAPEAAPYVTARAIVHYVTSGPQAPLLTDADGNGFPFHMPWSGTSTPIQ